MPSCSGSRDERLDTARQLQGRAPEKVEIRVLNLFSITNCQWMKTH